MVIMSPSPTDNENLRNKLPAVSFLDESTEEFHRIFPALS
jgi:hypothetical protein